MSDEMQIHIEESPFGDKGVTYTGMLGMFNHFRLQLISYRKQNKTPEERAHLEADIAGYEEVLKSNSEKNAMAFMEAKRGKKYEENFEEQFANNMDVVNYLKAQGLWEVK